MLRRELKLTETMSGQKRKFEAIENSTAKIYVCGITPYSESHVGHGRCYVNFDTLVRVLIATGYDVKYVRNYTDIDDKIIDMIPEGELSIDSCKAYTEKYINSFEKTMLQLNCLEPSASPKVTENGETIISFIEELEKKGFTYKVESDEGTDIYFEIDKFREYGKLSGKTPEKLQMLPRVDNLPGKKKPYDFALWKGNKKKLFWNSKWGYGRPGWHIECSALSRKELGKTLDIHGGGADLIFPHHENEIAQSEACNGTTFANYWIHNAHVNVDKEKMSKSLKNSFALPNLLTSFPPMAVRFYFLQHHYRKPINFSLQSVASALNGYKKFKSFFDGADTGRERPDRIGTDFLKSGKRKEIDDYLANLSKIGEEFFAALRDDLNSPRAIALIFENCEFIRKDEKIKNELAWLVENLLGIQLNHEQLDAKEKKGRSLSEDEIKRLIKEREAARAARDWKTADKIREILIQEGVNIHDKKIS